MPFQADRTFENPDEVLSAYRTQYPQYASWGPKTLYSTLVKSDPTLKDRVRSNSEPAYTDFQQIIGMYRQQAADGLASLTDDDLGKQILAEHPELGIFKAPPKEKEAPVDPAELAFRTRYPQWVGPRPKGDIAMSPKGVAYQNILDRNAAGRMGFGEGFVSNAEDMIPYYATVTAAADIGKLALTARRLQNGASVDDEELLDLNLYLADQDRASNATWWGKAGSTIASSFGFAGEFAATAALLALFAPAGAASAAGAAAPRVAASAGRKFLERFASKRIWDIAGEAAEKAAQKGLASLSKGVAKEAGEKALEVASKRAGFRLLTGAAGAAARAATGGAIQTGLSTGAQLAFTGNLASAEELKLYAALGNTEMSDAKAATLGVLRDYIERTSEFTGEGTAKLLGLALPAKIAARIAAMAGSKATTASAEQLAKVTKKAQTSTGLALALQKYAAKHNIDTVSAMKSLKQVGFDGIIQEMLEERVGGFYHGLFGTDGTEGGLRKAVEEAIPTTDDAMAELIAFSIPIVGLMTVQKAQLHLAGAFGNDVVGVLDATKAITGGEPRFNPETQQLERNIAVRESSEQYQAQKEVLIGAGRAGRDAAQSGLQSTGRFVDFIFNLATLPVHWDPSRLAFGSTVERAMVEADLPNIIRNYSELADMAIKSGMAEKAAASDTSSASKDEKIEKAARKIAETALEKALPVAMFKMVLLRKDLTAEEDAEMVRRFGRKVKKADGTEEIEFRGSAIKTEEDGDRVIVSRGIMASEIAKNDATPFSSFLYDELNRQGFDLLVTAKERGTMLSATSARDAASSAREMLEELEGDPQKQLNFAMIHGIPKHVADVTSPMFFDQFKVAVAPIVERLRRQKDHSSVEPGDIIRESKTGQEFVVRGVRDDNGVRRMRLAEWYDGAPQKERASEELVTDVGLSIETDEAGKPKNRFEKLPDLIVAVNRSKLLMTEEETDEFLKSIKYSAKLAFKEKRAYDQITVDGKKVKRYLIGSGAYNYVRAKDGALIVEWSPASTVYHQIEDLLQEGPVKRSWGSIEDAPGVKTAMDALRVEVNRAWDIARAEARTAALVGAKDDPSAASRVEKAVAAVNEKFRYLLEELIPAAHDEEMFFKLLNQLELSYGKADYGSIEPLLYHDEIADAFTVGGSTPSRKKSMVSAVAAWNAVRPLFVDAANMLLAPGWQTTMRNPYIGRAKVAAEEIAEAGSKTGGKAKSAEGKASVAKQDRIPEATPIGKKPQASAPPKEVLPAPPTPPTPPPEEVSPERKRAEAVAARLAMEATDLGLTVGGAFDPTAGISLSLEAPQVTAHAALARKQSLIKSVADPDDPRHVEYGGLIEQLIEEGDPEKRASIAKAATDLIFSVAGPVKDTPKARTTTALVMQAMFGPDNAAKATKAKEAQVSAVSETPFAAALLEFLPPELKAEALRAQGITDSEDEDEAASQGSIGLTAEARLKNLMTNDVVARAFLYYLAKGVGKTQVRLVLSKFFAENTAMLNRAVFNKATYKEYYDAVPANETAAQAAFRYAAKYTPYEDFVYLYSKLIAATTTVIPANIQVVSSTDGHWALFGEVLRAPNPHARRATERLAVGLREAMANEKIRTSLATAAEAYRKAVLDNGASKTTRKNAALAVLKLINAEPAGAGGANSMWDRLMEEIEGTAKARPVGSTEGGDRVLDASHAFGSLVNGILAVSEWAKEDPAAWAKTNWKVAAGILTTSGTQLLSATAAKLTKSGNYGQITWTEWFKARYNMTTGVPLSSRVGVNALSTFVAASTWAETAQTVYSPEEHKAYQGSVFHSPATTMAKNLGADVYLLPGIVIGSAEAVDKSHREIVRIDRMLSSKSLDLANMTAEDIAYLQRVAVNGAVNGYLNPKTKATTSVLFIPFFGVKDRNIAVGFKGDIAFKGVELKADTELTEEQYNQVFRNLSDAWLSALPLKNVTAKQLIGFLVKRMDKLVSGGSVLAPVEGGVRPVEEAFVIDFKNDWMDGNKRVSPDWAKRLLRSFGDWAALNPGLEGYITRGHVKMGQTSVSPEDGEMLVDKTCVDLGLGGRKNPEVEAMEKVIFGAGYDSYTSTGGIKIFENSKKEVLNVPMPDGSTMTLTGYRVKINTAELRDTTNLEHEIKAGEVAHPISSYYGPTPSAESVNAWIAHLDLVRWLAAVKPPIKPESAADDTALYQKYALMVSDKTAALPSLKAIVEVARKADVKKRTDDMFKAYGVPLVIKPAGPIGYNRAIQEYKVVGGITNASGVTTGGTIVRAAMAQANIAAPGLRTGTFLHGATREELAANLRGTQSDDPVVVESSRRWLEGHLTDFYNQAVARDVNYDDLFDKDGNLLLGELSDYSDDDKTVPTMRVKSRVAPSVYLSGTALISETVPYTPNSEKYVRLSTWATVRLTPEGRWAVGIDNSIMLPEGLRKKAGRDFDADKDFISLAEPIKDAYGNWRNPKGPTLLEAVGALSSADDKLFGIHSLSQEAKDKVADIGLTGAWLWYLSTTKEMSKVMKNGFRKARSDLFSAKFQLVYAMGWQEREAETSGDYFDTVMVPELDAQGRYVRDVPVKAKQVLQGKDSAEILRQFGTRAIQEKMASDAQMSAKLRGNVVAWLGAFNLLVRHLGAGLKGKNTMVLAFDLPTSTGGKLHVDIPLTRTAKTILKAEDRDQASWQVSLLFMQLVTAAIDAPTKNVLAPLGIDEATLPFATAILSFYDPSAIQTEDDARGVLSKAMLFASHPDVRELISAERRFLGNRAEGYESNGVMYRGRKAVAAYLKDKKLDNSAMVAAALDLRKLQQSAQRLGQVMVNHRKHADTISATTSRLATLSNTLKGKGKIEVPPTATRELTAASFATSMDYDVWAEVPARWFNGPLFQKAAAELADKEVKEDAKEGDEEVIALHPFKLPSSQYASLEVIAQRVMMYTALAKKLEAAGGLINGVPAALAKVQLLANTGVQKADGSIIGARFEGAPLLEVGVSRGFPVVIARLLQAAAGIDTNNYLVQHTEVKKKSAPYPVVSVITRQDSELTDEEVRRFYDGFDRLGESLAGGKLVVPFSLESRDGGTLVTTPMAVEFSAQELKYLWAWYATAQREAALSQVMSPTFQAEIAEAYIAESKSDGVAAKTAYFEAVLDLMPQFRSGKQEKRLMPTDFVAPEYRAALGAIIRNPSVKAADGIAVAVDASTLTAPVEAVTPEAGFRTMATFGGVPVTYGTFDKAVELKEGILFVDFVKLETLYQATSKDSTLDAWAKAQMSEALGGEAVEAPAGKKTEVEAPKEPEAEVAPPAAPPTPQLPPPVTAAPPVLSEAMRQTLINIAKTPVGASPFYIDASGASFLKGVPLIDPSAPNAEALKSEYAPVIDFVVGAGNWEWNVPDIDNAFELRPQVNNLAAGSGDRWAQLLATVAPKPQTGSPSRAGKNSAQSKILSVKGLETLDDTSFSLLAPEEVNKTVQTVRDTLVAGNADPRIISLLDRLTPDQRNALAGITQWMEDKNAYQFSAIAGAAGTGKTTVLSIIAQYAATPRRIDGVVKAPIGAVVATAYNKAASRVREVLGQRGVSGIDVKTLYKLLYEAPKEDRYGNLTFEYQGASIPEGLLLVDESSVVTARLWNDMKLLAKDHKNLKIALLGDFFQAEPILNPGEVDPSLLTSRSPIYTETRGSNMYLLRQVMRQKGDLLTAVTAIRMAKEPTVPSFNLDGVTLASSADDLQNRWIEAIMKAVAEGRPTDQDVFLTYRNDNRVLANKALRLRRGIAVDAAPQAGETLMAISNSDTYSNGEVLEPSIVFRPIGPAMVQTIPSGTNKAITPYTVIPVMDQGGKKALFSPDFPNPSVQVKYIINSSNGRFGKEFKKSNVLTLGSAMTILKSQGSEFPRVYVDARIPDFGGALKTARILYTAMTRAQQGVFVFAPGSMNRFGQEEIDHIRSQMYDPTKVSYSLAWQNDAETQRLMDLKADLQSRLRSKLRKVHKPVFSDFKVFHTDTGAVFKLLTPGNVWVMTEYDFGAKPISTHPDYVPGYGGVPMSEVQAAKAFESSLEKDVDTEDIYEDSDTGEPHSLRNVDFGVIAEVVEEWKRANGVVYNPNDAYSRNEGIFHDIGAFNDKAKGFLSGLSRVLLRQEAKRRSGDLDWTRDTQNQLVVSAYTAAYAKLVTDPSQVPGAFVWTSKGSEGPWDEPASQLRYTKNSDGVTWTARRYEFDTDSNKYELSGTGPEYEQVVGEKDIVGLYNETLEENAASVVRPGRGEGLRFVVRPSIEDLIWAAVGDVYSGTVRKSYSQSSGYSAEELSMVGEFEVMGNTYSPAEIPVPGADGGVEAGIVFSVNGTEEISADEFRDAAIVAGLLPSIKVAATPTVEVQHKAPRGDKLSLLSTTLADAIAGRWAGHYNELGVRLRLGNFYIEGEKVKPPKFEWKSGAWYLAYEKNDTLAGDHLEDVIFSGPFATAKDAMAQTADWNMRIKQYTSPNQNSDFLPTGGIPSELRRMNEFLKAAFISAQGSLDPIAPYTPKKVRRAAGEVSYSLSSEDISALADVAGRKNLSAQEAKLVRDIDDEALLANGTPDQLRDYAEANRPKPFDKLSPYEQELVNAMPADTSYSLSSLAWHMRYEANRFWYMHVNDGPRAMHRIFLDEITKTDQWREEALRAIHHIQRIFGRNGVLYDMPDLAAIKSGKGGFFSRGALLRGLKKLATLTTNEEEMVSQYRWVPSALLEHLDDNGDAVVAKILDDTTTTDAEKRAKIESMLGDVMVTWGHTIVDPSDATKVIADQESALSVINRFKAHSAYAKMTGANRNWKEHLDWFTHLQALRRFYESFPSELKQTEGYVQHQFGAGFRDAITRTAESAVAMALRNIAEPANAADTMLAEDAYATGWSQSNPPKATKSQLDLYNQLTGEEFELKDLEENGLDLPDMNRLLVSELYKAAVSHERLVALAAQYPKLKIDTTPKVAPQSQLISTLKKLKAVTSQYSGMEWAPTMLTRRIKGSMARIFAENKEKGASYKPGTMDFLDLQQRYLLTTTEALRNRALARELPMILSEDGMPLLMVIPSERQDKIPLIPLDVLAEMGSRWASALGLRFDPTTNIRGQLKALAEKMNPADFETYPAPFTSVESFIVRKGDAQNVLRHWIQKPKQWQLFGIDWAYQLARIANWSKLIGVSYSVFFPSSIAESIVAGTGWKNNVLWGKDPRGIHKGRGLGTAVHVMRDFGVLDAAGDPDMAHFMGLAARAGIQLGRAAPIDAASGIVERDIDLAYNAVLERWGEKPARILRKGMELWSGRPMSDLYFGRPGVRGGLFQASKMYAVDMMARETAKEMGGDWDRMDDKGKLFVLKQISGFINPAYGGTFWAQHLWAVPTVMQALNLLLFAANWCAPFGTRAMTRNGFKHHDELKIGDEILIFDPKTRTTRWSPIRDKFEREDYEGDMVYVRSRGSREIAFTPEHTCYVETRTGVSEVVKAKDLLKKHKIPRCADFDGLPETETVSDRLVQLTGWLVTDGSVKRKAHTLADGTATEYRYGRICQSKPYGVASLKALGLSFYTTPLKDTNFHANFQTHTFAIPVREYKVLETLGIVDGKLSWEFISRLTKRQLILLEETMMLGDGTGQNRFCGEESEIFWMTLIRTLLGKPVTFYEQKQEGAHCWRTRALVNRHIRCNTGAVSTRPYKGGIWCPSVETGFWVAENNGLVFITGNTFSAFNVAGGGLLTGALLGNAPDHFTRRMILRNASVMFPIVLGLTPLALQTMAWGIGGAAGSNDPDDTPLPWKNEEGRKTYVDITPFMRTMPWYKGDPTGKRRVYLRFGKQAWEVYEGWFTKPLSTALGKTSVPFKIVYEQLLGKSPGSDWTLEFSGKGLAGWFLTTDYSGERSFLKSRFGYLAQKVIPMAVLSSVQTSDAGIFAFIAPVSHGTSQGKATAELITLFNTVADSDSWKKIRRTPGMTERLSAIGAETLNSATRNGYDADKIMNTAKGVVLGRLYKEFTAAMSDGDTKQAEVVANRILRVGGTIRGLTQSVTNRRAMAGRAITDEERAAIEMAFGSD